MVFFRIGILLVLLLFNEWYAKGADSLNIAITPHVVEVVHIGKHASEAGLGDYIKVKVEHIKALMDKAGNAHNIILYLNDVPTRIHPEFISQSHQEITFKLTRDTASIRSWNVFYQSQILQAERIVTVSVGIEKEGPIPTEVTNFKLLLVRKNLLYGTIAGILALLVLFIIIASKTRIIRDESLTGKDSPFSLSRSQLAFWTFIIIFSFLYIYLVTGEIPPLTESTMALLCISISTTAGARVIDDLQQEQKQQDFSSEGFLKDLLSDKNGINIHRFQLVLWTIVLGFFFLRSVLKDLEMPAFDNNLLILMGVSSTTYVGLKIPENSTKDNTKEKDTAIDKGIPPEIPGIPHSISNSAVTAHEEEMPAVG